MSDKAIEAMIESGAIGIWVHEDDRPQMALSILAALKAARIAVVELPEAHQIEVVEIDMQPEDEDGDLLDPELMIRFKDIPNPGRLFDNRELAAALLAAAEGGVR